MKGTVYELYWYIISIHKFYHIKCTDFRARTMILFAEGVMMNYLGKDDVLTDIQYIANNTCPITWTTEDSQGKSDMTEWISERKEKLIFDFKTKNYSSNILNQIEYVIAELKDMDMRDIYKMLWSKNSPCYIYSQEYWKWYKRHWDEKGVEKKFYIPKQEIRKWIFEKFYKQYYE